MRSADLLLVVASALYLGFQWTIRVLVYPQFATVGREDFVAYEQRHQHLVSIAVGPLFALQGVAVLVVLAGGVTAPALCAAAAYAGILLVTARLAVPAHRRLSDGFDASVHRRLLVVDAVRLALAALALAAAVWLSARR